jgi:hypothetical protein
MALQAQLAACFWTNLPVRIMARRTVESGRAADLMRMTKVLLLGHIRMAAVADMRRKRTEILRLFPQRSHIDWKLLLQKGNELLT